MSVTYRGHTHFSRELCGSTMPACNLCTHFTCMCAYITCMHALHRIKAEENLTVSSEEADNVSVIAADNAQMRKHHLSDLATHVRHTWTKILHYNV